MSSLKLTALNEVKDLADTYNNNYNKFPDSFQIAFKQMLFSLTSFIRCCEINDECLLEKIIYIQGNKAYLNNLSQSRLGEK